MLDCLLSHNIDELKEILGKLKEPSFRAKQIFQWVQKGAEFDQMRNIPKSLTKKLSENYTSTGLKIYEELVSKEDGTRKYLYQLNDNNLIEGVLMKYKYGNTLCVSTQVGCRMNCSFCASGIDGLVRDLTPAEILGQIVCVNAHLGGDLVNRKVTNVVLMGSGEPLDNYDNVTKFFDLVTDKEGINISPRNISLSTSGLCPNIKRLADDGYTITLTISLHAPNNEIRSSIMPVNKKYQIEELVDSAKYYFNKTKRRVIFEYALIAGVNDTLECADELSRLLRGFSCHINLIRLNYVKEKGLMGATNDNAKQFLKRLEENNMSATIRRTMGRDIEGACGQLRRSYLENGGN